MLIPRPRQSRIALCRKADTHVAGYDLATGLLSGGNGVRQIDICAFSHLFSF